MFVKKILSTKKNVKKGRYPTFTVSCNLKQLCRLRNSCQVLCYMYTDIISKLTHDSNLNHLNQFRCA